VFGWSSPTGAHLPGAHPLELTYLELTHWSSQLACLELTPTGAHPPELTRWKSQLAYLDWSSSTGPHLPGAHPLKLTARADNGDTHFFWCLSSFGDGILLLPLFFLPFSSGIRAVRSFCSVSPKFRDENAVAALYFSETQCSGV
jgi:hypothetical protein